MRAAHGLGATRKVFRLVLLCLLTVVAGSWVVPATVTSAAADAKVLIVNQSNSEYPQASQDRGQQVQMLLRHFTPETTLVNASDYAPGALFGYRQVVVIGNDAIARLPEAFLFDVARAGRPVLWIGYGLDQLQLGSGALGFSPGFATSADLPTGVEYRGHRYRATIDEYHAVRIDRPSVQVLAQYIRPTSPVPYILRDGDLWYVNGLPSLATAYPDETYDAPVLIFADALHEFFHTGIATDHQAVIRLEDVSVNVDPERLMAVADLLNREQVPFVIGVIPAQQFADGTVVRLQARPEFVRALRYAQDRGGVVALHGYNHTFGSGEDFEFWDKTANGPLPDENWAMYASKVEDGIRLLRDAGIEPRLWETPHYAASPLAYEVFGRYFSHAIENRDPVSWLPYPSGPDPYGQILIPETIGYINPAEGWTVAAQLQRAELLKIVRDGWAVGFYHPANIPLGELEQLLHGLRALDYRFVDLGSVQLKTSFLYEPSPVARIMTWVRSELPIVGKNLEATLERRARWLGDVARVPIVIILSAALASLFLVRLRAQWRPSRVAARSVVAEASALPSRIAALGLLGIAAILVATTALAAAEPPAVAHPSAAPGDSAGPSSIAPAERVETSSGWEISVYFTAVERFYTGPLVSLRGCSTLDCASGDEDLGRYPADFLQAVLEEGSGHITSDKFAGHYLNWSVNVGYWLDSAPRDARGAPLEPFVSAAADLTVAYLTEVTVVSCGNDVARDTPVDPSVCSRIALANWIVRDRFSQGTVGKHVDLYVGEQDQPNFLSASPIAIHTRGASLKLRVLALGP